MTRRKKVNFVELPAIAPTRAARMALEGYTEHRMEDGGQALILELDDPNSDHVFIRLQSYVDYEPGHENLSIADRHPKIGKLVGKRLKITIEWEE